MTNPAARLGKMRATEKASIVLFLLAATVILSLAASPRALSSATHPDASILVSAYNMPDHGWAPLTVYFSAFGSRDPDGVIVRYEWDLDANGSFETDATATDGYTSYTYVKPGEYTVSLRVTDDEGGTALASVLVSARHPAASSVDYWSIFDQTQVRRVDFIVSQANWDRMWEDPWLKTKVEADVILFGERIDRVGLSMKGNASLDASGAKKSWKVDTDLFIPEQEYKNLKQLLFHNNFADASMLREKLAYDMMRFAGLPSSHVSFIELYIDIEDDDKPPIYWGVYTLLERPDRKYLSNNYGRESRHGNLYKAYANFEEGAIDFVYYGENFEDYPRPRGKYAYNPETNVENHDFSDIIELTYTIDGVTYDTPEEFASALEQVMAVQNYLRFQAVNIVNLNLDTHPYTGNNFYLYHNPTTDLFEFIPWDMNNAWGHFGGNANFPLFGNVENVGPVTYAPLFENTFEVQRYRQDYAAYVDLMVRYWFNEKRVAAQAQGWHNLIRPYLTKETGDKAYFGPTAMYSFEQFEQDRLQLIELTSERSQFLLVEAAKLWPRKP
jgi:spore coat protein H